MAGRPLPRASPAAAVLTRRACSEFLGRCLRACRDVRWEKRHPRYRRATHLAAGTAPTLASCRRSWAYGSRAGKWSSRLHSGQFWGEPRPRCRVWHLSRQEASPATSRFQGECCCPISGTIGKRTAQFVGDGRVALRVPCREPAGALDEKRRPPAPAASATACDLVKPSKARVFSKLRLDTGDCVENLPQVGSEMLRQCLLHHP